MSSASATLTRPTRATLAGLLTGTGLALVAALGPLVSAITITVGVETQVGETSGLPDARMLPAALEGAGAVALISLLTRRPRGHPRLWGAALIAISLGAGMAALHPVVRMAEDLIATVRLLLVTPEDGEAGGRRRSSRPDSWDGSPVPRPPAAALEAKVLRLLRANPHATWRVVRDRTGLSEANAKRALTAARKQLQRSSQEVGEAAGA